MSDTTTNEAPKAKNKGKRKPFKGSKPKASMKNVITTSRDIERSGKNVIVKTSFIDKVTHKEADKASYSVRFDGVEKLVPYANMFEAREGAKGPAPEVVEHEKVEDVKEDATA